MNKEEKEENKSSTGFSYRAKPSSTGFNYRENKGSSNLESKEENKDIHNEQPSNPTDNNIKGKNRKNKKGKERKRYSYKEDKKAFMLHYTKIFCTLASILTLIIIGFSILESKQIEKVNNSRITTLDNYERSNIWVTDDLILYLSIKDEASWKKFREEAHMTNEFKDKLVNREFNYAYFPEKENIEVKDVQYSFATEKAHPLDYKVYALASYKDKESGKTRVINYIVYMSNNKIYNMLAY